MDERGMADAPAFAARQRAELEAALTQADTQRRAARAAEQAQWDRAQKLAAEIDGLRARIAAARRTTDALLAERDAARRDSADAQSENARLAEECDTLRAALDALEPPRAKHGANAVNQAAPGGPAAGPDLATGAGKLGLSRPRPWLPPELSDYHLPHQLRDHLFEAHSEASLPLVEYAMALVARFENDQAGFTGTEIGAGLIARVAQAAQDRGVPDAPAASVVIPVYGNLLFTLTAILSLLDDTSSPPFEILVGDDRSRDGTAAVLGAMGGPIRVETHARNLGFLGNCNATASLARGRCLVLLNNDTVALPGFLGALLELLDREPDAGLVGAKLLNADGTLQEAGGIIWQDGSARNYGRGKDARLPEFNYVKQADYISGAAIALPLPVWQELGGFDQLYSPAYCEDSDLAFRVRAAGKTVLYQPRAEIIHHEGRSHGTDVTTGGKAYQVTNSQKLLARWGGVFAREQLPKERDMFVARDRSRRRPHILVVDHYVPQPDRDAGSRTMTDYISLFLDRGFRVSFWPENLFEDVPYVRPLQQRGVEVLYGASMVDGFEDWLAEAAPWLDAVLMSRPHITLRYLPFVRELYSGPVLYYGHDLHWRRLANEAALTGDPATAQKSLLAREEEREVFKGVDVAMYPSAEECALVRADAASKLTVLDVPAYLFSDATLAEGRRRAAEIASGTSRDLLFVGGFGHGPNADAVRWFAAEVLPLLRAAGAGARLRIAGSKAGPEIHALAAADVEVLGQVSDTELDALYRGAAAVIAPLRFGGGVKGKVIEAFGKGRPVVATPVGMQGIVQGKGAGGPVALVAETAEAFAHAVADTLNDRAAAAARARLALDYLQGRYTADAMAGLLAPHVPALLGADRP